MREDSYADDRLTCLVSSPVNYSAHLETPPPQQSLKKHTGSYTDVQKSVPVKLARLLLDITIGCCFDSHPRIDSVLQNSGFRY
jgi:hypothetical protein